jgi:23S rRNA-/tRNA-specific pseudouridylate synthase
MPKFSLTQTVGPNDPATACDFLAAFTSLSKSRIKNAMTKGAVWLKRPKHKHQRLRRATAELEPVELYYKPERNAYLI